MSHVYSKMLKHLSTIATCPACLTQSLAEKLIQNADSRLLWNFFLGRSPDGGTFGAREERNDD